ncbi:D-alanyl-D-alanine carboxypeptidase family protein [Clostridium formicaceticum]|uniref:serine-type D-Ala-D-Ala carboxypeptidase n=1 Tax=Clostridium formicaceticum TaxID=1497 RepID=A0AAC9WG25_9CLOT|nr:D-alanyl-D-alanine carboxypeptidase family protein [Clostridium formicaceticum]AOY76879.1 D-alanyl-D-alanine carboxypeptidase [Clostridium formicaceticum]ARE87359.1 D-alanyl-D-alanine carboxypeptidase DacF precursor [Clostridium formicaceticum]
MSKKLNILFLMLLILIFSTAITSAAYADLNITAPNAVLIDYTTGKVLFDHNAHEVAYPASTTKVMTAILVLENTNLNDVITIQEDTYVDGASAYLLKGESFTVEELLKTLLIRSANDVAEVLAYHVSGSIEAFAQLMNERAKELGALNTHFTNPHGLPDENHVTTAYDLAVIGKHAMSFDIFREIVSTVNFSLEATEFTPEARHYRNTNRFLWGTGGANRMLYNGAYTNIQYDLIDGIKTGYTRAAQQCLITSSIKNDHRFIAVVLGAQGVNIYSDSRSLVDYGYDHFQLVQLVEKNQLKIESPIENGTQDTIPLYTEETLYAVVPKALDLSFVHEEIIVNEDIAAPIAAGDILGRVVYSIEDEVLGEVDLIVEDDVEVKPLLRRITIPSNLIIALVVLFLLWQLIVITIRLKRRRGKRGFYSGKHASSYKFSRSLLNKRK